MSLHELGSANSPAAGLDPSSWIAALGRANQVAVVQNFAEMLAQLLSLSVELSQAQAGMLYLLEPATHELVCQAAQGEAAQAWRGWRMELESGPLAEVAQQQRSLFLEGAELATLSLPDGAVAQNTLILPLWLPGRFLGVLQVLNCEPAAQALMEMVVTRLAPDIERASQLEAERLRSSRLDALIGIFQQIGATLDRDQILWMMVDYAREVIGAEASSLFLVDEERGDIVLHVASNLNERVLINDVRVPAGKGIIGHVVEAGEVVLVPDVSRDKRHYGAVDQSSGFMTRSILAVPLRSRQVVLGGEMGSIKERVIGGFEALNKIQGTFDEEDAELLTILANQAATVLEIAGLYADANELFLDVVKVMTAAIDAKDPYTEGHSQRVSDFSVQIAREMNLPDEVVHHVKIGSLLHDVGKIGVPDVILVKPGRLTDEEYALMKQHPAIGEKIMGEVRMLRSELPAISEHHERLDGRGYPKGMKAEGISLFGRIVAVADVFDALTSHRPYRQAQSAEEVLDYLYRGVESEFDRACVDALVRAYTNGKVQTQAEREKLDAHNKTTDQ